MTSKRILLQLPKAPSRFAIYQPRPILQPISRPILQTRPYSESPAAATTSPVEAPSYLDENERKVFHLIKESLKPTKLEVQDISGGCGSMYALDIVSEKFTGLPVIKQHRLVNKVLGEEIKKWHGVQLKTKAP